MPKIIQWTLSIIFGVATIGAVTFIVWALNSEDTKTEPQANEAETQTAMEPVKGSTDETFDTPPSELDFRETLHRMTHQKVRASKKWGHVQITKQRIDEMLIIAKESDFDDKEFYIRALQEWKNGNFNNAIEVHNHIWKKKNGTIGKAVGLMSPEDEQKYVERHFE